MPLSESERRAVGRTVPIPGDPTLSHEARLAMHGIPLPGGSGPSPVGGLTGWGIRTGFGITNKKPWGSGSVFGV